MSRNAQLKGVNLSYFELSQKMAVLFLLSNMMMHIFLGHKNSPFIKIKIFDVHKMPIIMAVWKYNFLKTEDFFNVNLLQAKGKF